MAVRMTDVLLIRDIPKVALAWIRPGIQTTASRVTLLFANIHFVGCFRHVAGGGSNKTNPISYE
jgi:hypothetical protein